MDDNKIQEVELTALRNEMREWQGRRFILATIGVAFTGAAVGLTKEGGVPPYYRSMAVLGLLWMLSMLTWYATLANRRGRDYIKARYPQFEWEAQVDRDRSALWASRLQLSHTLLLLYLLLGVGHLVFAYLASTHSLCILREGYVVPTSVAGGVMAFSWLIGFLSGLQKPNKPKTPVLCIAHASGLRALVAGTPDPAPEAFVNDLRGCPRCNGAAEASPHPKEMAFCSIHTSGISMLVDKTYGATPDAFIDSVRACAQCRCIAKEKPKRLRESLYAFACNFAAPQAWMLLATGLVVLAVAFFGVFNCLSCS